MERCHRVNRILRFRRARTYLCNRLLPPKGCARNRSKTPICHQGNERTVRLFLPMDKPRIIAIGLLIFRIPLSAKYGIWPCKRFKFVSVFDARSDATKCWKIVDASLYAFISSYHATEIRNTYEIRPHSRTA
jgi:hypothetical protein